MTNENKNIIIDEEKGNDINHVLYAVLLEKYVNYIMDCEGTDYIHVHDNRYMSDVKFTDNEWEILEEISKRCNYTNGI
jgi:hypothetical protein